jgi:translation initiation factor 6 (eIF-6)
VTRLEVVGSPALGVQKVEEMAVVQEVEEKAAVQAVEEKAAVQVVEEKVAVQGTEGTARVEEEMVKDEIVAMQDLEC